MPRRLPSLLRISMIAATLGTTAMGQGAFAQDTAPPAEATGFGLDFDVFDQQVTPADTAGLSDAALPLPGFLAAGGAFDATEPDLVLSLRAGVQVGPAYFGSNDYETGPDVAVRLDYLRFPNGFEIGSSRAVGFRTGLGLRTSVRYISDRDSADYDELTGLENVDWAFEMGLGLGYEQRNYRVFADARYGVIGHNAWVGEIGADGIAYPVDGLTLTLGPRVGFGTQRFTDTYFGISGSEAGVSDLDAYEPDGGAYEAGVLLGARYLFNERWGVEADASWDRLLNGAADSPITEMGSADQYEVRLGITRRIGLDF